MFWLTLRQYVQEGVAGSSVDIDEEQDSEDEKAESAQIATVSGTLHAIDGAMTTPMQLTTDSPRSTPVVPMPPTAPSVKRDNIDKTDPADKVVKTIKTDSKTKTGKTDSPLPKDSSVVPTTKSASPPKQESRSDAESGSSVPITLE